MIVIVLTLLPKGYDFLYRLMLFLLGFGFSIYYTENAFVSDLFHFLGLLLLFAAVSSAWLASVVVNDCADEGTDKLTNPQRPIPSARFIPHP